MPKQKLGIGRRIGRLVAFAVFSAVFAVSLILAVMRVNNDIETARRNLQNSGYALAATAADAVVSRDRKKAFESLSAMSRMPDVLVVAVTDSDSKTLAHLGQTAVLSTDLANMESSNPTLLLRGSMPVAVDIIKGGVVVGRLILLADITKVRRDFIFTTTSTFLAALVAALIGVLVSLPLQLQVVGPVRALTKQITDIKASRNFATELHVSRDIGEVGQLVDSFASLMSDIRFRDESLQKLAYFDPITGLANHASLLNKIGELGTDVGAAIAIFNIRGFRTLTNAFGRTIGDAIILSVAAGIRENANGAFVARLGAHEFAVLATGVWSQSDAEKLVAPIMAAFMRPMAIMSSEITIDLDCGVALSPSEPDGSKDLVRCASLALFEAGSLGPNRTVFYQHNMQEKALLEAELRQELKHALAVRELEVHYQPQVEARTGIVTGFEALARWKHAVRGYVPPSVFIPIAEDSGLIAQIGDWVLDESCRQTAEWFKQSGVFYAISVNVSASQLMDSTFVLKVKNALARHGLPSQFLCLEVTESIFAGAGMAELVDSLGRLRDMDVKLALDDFGTGYSSLDYLAKMPLHTIKIDRSFVAEAQQSSRRTSMLSSIIGMCQGLGLDTVAEGAETPEDIALLQQLKVDKIQGYGIAKPMRAEEALAFANSYHQGSPTRAIA